MFNFYWTLDPSWTASNEITLVRLSVCPSVITFFKIESLVFFDIVHDDRWPWYLVTEEESGPEFGPNGRKLDSKWGFLPISWVWIICFLEVRLISLKFLGYDDSLRQCLTSSRGITHEEKFWGPKFGPNGPKLGPKLGYLPFSQVWFISFPLICIGW